MSPPAVSCLHLAVLWHNSFQQGAVLSAFGCTVAQQLSAGCSAVCIWLYCGTTAFSRLHCCLHLAVLWHNSFQQAALLSPVCIWLWHHSFQQAAVLSPVCIWLYCDTTAFSRLQCCFLSAFGCGTTAFSRAHWCVNLRAVY